AFPQLVQWYEYTGVFGGSAWILIVNILLFRGLYFSFKHRIIDRPVIAHMAMALLFLIVPIVYSINTYNNYAEERNPIDVVVIQPNIDPYNEQYNSTPSEVLDHIFELVEMKADSTTDFVVAPESVIQERPLYENYLERGKSIKLLKEYAEKHPGRAVVIGASTYYIVPENEEPPIEARPFSNSERYYVAYNTAIYMDSAKKEQLYHKSKLTPGVEKMPFKKLFKHIENLAIDLGGTVGTLGTDPYRIPFETHTGDKIAPIICYESIYGEFCAKFVRNGADAFFIITNDGWWGNTPGHRQHLQFASLRAIESRRSIARSANTGISAFINQRGDILKATEYWEEDVIRNKMNTNEEITFYVQYGDYIGRTAVFGTVMLLLITITGGIMRKTRRIIR
ncbi:MAG TPA: apolipoprotein N-acyltransferase, partial [Bacteroidales bacterium]|nr:apolipoprotein N-acyltransferase [Bacteroidales bacterium]